MRHTWSARIVLTVVYASTVLPVALVAGRTAAAAGPLGRIAALHAVEAGVLRTRAARRTVVPVADVAAWTGAATRPFGGVVAPNAREAAGRVCGACGLHDRSWTHFAHLAVLQEVTQAVEGLRLVLAFPGEGVNGRYELVQGIHHAHWKKKFNLTKM